MSIETERKFISQEYYGWRAREDMAKKYIEVCAQANLDGFIFEHFKSLDGYKDILEHVDPHLGGEYLKNIIENNSDLLINYRKYFINDIIGSPYKTLYKNDKLNNFSLPPVSPTTLRYMKVLSDLTGLFSSLNDMNIVEIGGGYGGQALIISKKFKFKNYYNVDLSEPIKLSKKYCAKHDLDNFIGYESSEIDELKDMEIDLVISNYAFSECNFETQDIYIEKIFSKAKRGYITHNTNKERQSRTESIIKNYDNYRVFGYDLSPKKHPIYVWG